jgi:hypothetical protein
MSDIPAINLVSILIQRVLNLGFYRIAIHLIKLILVVKVHLKRRLSFIVVYSKVSTLFCVSLKNVIVLFFG